MLIFWNCAGVPLVYCFNSYYILRHGPFEHSTPYTVFCFVLLIGAYYIWDTCNSQKVSNKPCLERIYSLQGAGLTHHNNTLPQQNRFRMKLKGTYIPRMAFPQLPWGTLENPRYLKAECGSVLLTDGWYRYEQALRLSPPTHSRSLTDHGLSRANARRYARKIHYTADVMMALSWGLICGYTLLCLVGSDLSSATSTGSLIFSSILRFDHFLPYFYVCFFVPMITHRCVRHAPLAEHHFDALPLNVELTFVLAPPQGPPKVQEEVRQGLGQILRACTPHLHPLRHLRSALNKGQGTSPTLHNHTTVRPS
jgi:delta24(24(1))-sterol reductase